MLEELEKIPTEDLEIVPREIEHRSVIGTDDFNVELHKELNHSDKVWRSSRALSEKLNVDAVELDEFMRKNKEICSRPSKEEGIVLYALVKRLEKDQMPTPPPEHKEIDELIRPIGGEEDRYALASINNAFLVLDSAMKIYAMKIYERSPEVFTQLATARNKLEAAIVLFAKRIHADINKLPK